MMTQTTHNAGAKNPQIDFNKIEALRRSMLLTVENISDFFGVSRETYYNWQRGKYPRKKMEERVKQKIRLLLYVIAQHGWPTPEVISADQKDRFSMLLAITSQNE